MNSCKLKEHLFNEAVKFVLTLFWHCVHGWKSSTVSRTNWGLVSHSRSRVRSSLLSCKCTMLLPQIFSGEGKNFIKFMLLWSDWSPRRLWAEWWVQTFFWFYSSLQCGLSLTLPFSCSLINYYAYNKLYFYIIITTQYLVKWLNYSAFENSWEREENLPIDLVRSVLFMFSKYFK